MNNELPKTFLFFREEDIERIIPVNSFKIQAFAALFLVVATTLTHLFGA